MTNKDKQEQVKLVNTGPVLIDIMGTNVAPGRAITTSLNDFENWRVASSKNMLLSINSIGIVPVEERNDPVEALESESESETETETESAVDEKPKRARRRS